jgi:probable rRNA maturation factor
MSPDDIPLLFRASLSRRLHRDGLRAFFAAMVKRVARGREIACLITDDEELRRLNRQFRGADYPTDVLSFPSEAGGEIAISLDRAAVQAAEQGHSIDEEVRILMLHGALHLTGLDHETDAGEMARAEARWRKRLGLSCGLIERVHA